MLGGLIAGNTSTDAGGGVCANGSGTALQGGEIKHNKAKNGGGLYNAAGKAKLSGDIRITENLATVEGGGVYVNEGIIAKGTPTIQDNTKGTAKR